MQQTSMTSSHACCCYVLVYLLALITRCKSGHLCYDVKLHALSILQQMSIIRPVWCHRCSGPEFGQMQGDSGGRWGLTCYGPWDKRRAGHDLATELQQPFTQMCEAVRANQIKTIIWSLSRNPIEQIRPTTSFNNVYI